MTSYISLAVFGLLLVTIAIVVQSAPVEPSKSSVSNNEKTLLDSFDPITPSSVSTSSTTTASLLAIADGKTDAKKKRNIDDYDWFNDEENDTDNDDKIENILHAKVKETPAQIHDNIDQSAHTDSSKVFTDIAMNPNELMNIIRQRRNVNLNDQSNRRRKRALSTYNFYNDDPLYDSLFEQQQFIRPTRAFAPIYWYPSLYERNIRSALAPSFYEPSEWNQIYADTVENDDDIDDDQIPLFDIDDTDENEYESNRYPILLDSSDDPYDNFQLQQEYNVDDLPIDENDDNEEKQIYFTRYGPIETYLK